MDARRREQFQFYAKVGPSYENFASLIVTLYQKYRKLLFHVQIIVRYLCVRAINLLPWNIEEPDPSQSYFYRRIFSHFHEQPIYRYDEFAIVSFSVRLF